jgi:hypothetical protein
MSVLAGAWRTFGGTADTQGSGTRPIECSLAQELSGEVSLALLPQASSARSMHLYRTVHRDEMRNKFVRGRFHRMQVPHG